MSGYTTSPLFKWMFRLKESEISIKNIKDELEAFKKETKLSWKIQIVNKVDDTINL